MRKLLIGIILVLALGAVGCSSKNDIMELNLTPENKVEVLSRSEYMLRLEELFQENKFFGISEDEYMPKYKEDLEKLKEYFSKDNQEVKERMESIKMYFVNEKRIAEGLSSFKSEDDDINKIHYELFKVYKESYEYRKNHLETLKEGKEYHYNGVVSADLIARKGEVKENMIDVLGIELDLDM